MRYGSPSRHIRRGGGDQTPREMNAKFPGKCGRCSAAIALGDRIMYYPATRSVHCWPCSQSTREALDDETNGACPW